MIKAIGKLDCHAVEVESDPYVPLTITWATGSGQQPLYWRISGSHGGELEVKIDPQHGALLELIVIDKPPARKHESKSPSSLPNSESGVPIFDCSPWGVSVNPDYSEFTSRVIASSENVAFSMESGIARLVFSPKQAKRILVCGDVQVHLADEGYLAAVVAPIS